MQQLYPLYNELGLQLLLTCFFIFQPNILGFLLKSTCILVGDLFLQSFFYLFLELQKGCFVFFISGRL